MVPALPATGPDPAGFARGFCTRVRSLRRAAGMTQAEMALALGVTVAAYEKYETRSPLPHHLVEPFAALTGAGVEELLSAATPRGRRGPPRFPSWAGSVRHDRRPVL